MPPPDIEMRPLVVDNDDEKYTGKSIFSLNKKWLLVLGCVGVGALVYSIGGSSSSPQTTTSTNVSDEIHQAVQIDLKAGGAPSTLIDSKTKKKKIKTEAMLHDLAVAREQLADKLRHQYGKYYENIFFDSNGLSRGRTLFTSGDRSSNVSWARFQRKLMMKLLSVQTSKQAVPFVWATGGHSATAGHGNFYDESYTSYLEQSAQGVFQAVGLHFTGRNYAMGGTAASPEVAFCVKEIFGQDIDVLVWDFGMTDGKMIWKQSLYHYRAGLIDKSRPLNIAYHAGGSFVRGRTAAVKEMEDLGLAALISSEEVMNSAMDAVPDSFGLSEDEINQLPDFVRNFRCGNQIENGDPYCKDDKYNMTLCPNRKYRTNWHPGWKWQAVMGYLATFFLIEVLNDALNELASRADSDPINLLKELKAADDANYAKFVNAPVPESLQKILPGLGLETMDFNLLIKGHNFCHTARLPAESRHKGILTESAEKGFFTYDKGVELTKAATTANEGDLIRLVYTGDDRPKCPIPTIMDYKDYFYVNSNEDWKKLVLPNDAELDEYGNGQPLQGIIVMCFTVCPWNKCPKGVLDRSGFDEGKFELNINGLNVTSFVPFEECEILKHTGGYKWKPDKNGRFDVRARVAKDAEQGSYLRLSAFIVW